MKIAIAQLAIVDGDKNANLKKMEHAIKEATEKNAEIIVFPELMLTGLVKKDEVKALAEVRDGKSFKQIQAIVKQHPLSVVYSFLELDVGGEIYNTTCLIDHNGEALGYYRKIHLFGDEEQLFNRGDEWVVVEREDLRIGLLTCYDIEFPEPARALALQGVNLLIVNAANMAPYEYIHRLSIQMRALENQIFVVYCNRIGANKWFEYHGQSAAVGPDGSILADAGLDNEVVQVINLPIKKYHGSPATFNYLADRRPELYHTLCKV
jgi:predicted amidohydrolase